MSASVMLHAPDDGTCPFAEADHYDGARWITFYIGDDRLTLFVDDEQFARAGAVVEAFNAMYAPVKVEEAA